MKIKDIRKYVASGISDWYLKQGRFFEALIHDNFAFVKRICVAIFLMQIVIFALILFLLLQ